jgi:hypothetical protein
MLGAVTRRLVLSQHVKTRLFLLLLRKTENGHPTAEYLMPNPVPERVRKEIEEQVFFHYPTLRKSQESDNLNNNKLGPEKPAS